MQILKKLMDKPNYVEILPSIRNADNTWELANIINEGSNCNMDASNMSNCQRLDCLLLIVLTNLNLAAIAINLLCIKMSKPFSLHCDASDHAVGSVLVQNNADGHDHSIA